jgi:hypothetical protein
MTMPTVDRAAVMRRAHQIARQARPHMASYREALACGVKAAWGLIATRREFAAVRARVARVALLRTAEARFTHRPGGRGEPSRLPPIRRLLDPNSRHS